MTDAERLHLLSLYSSGAMTAIELRVRLDRATYGEVFRMLADAGQPLPRALTVGREADLARAREWMFPKDVEGDERDPIIERHCGSSTRGLISTT